MTATNLQKKTLIATGVSLLVLFAIGVFLPSTARIERTVSIDAPPATVHALVNDFHQILKWSPRLDADPNARVEFSGPRRGVGAAMTWSGSVVGAGRQAIVESVAFERVATELDTDGTGSSRTSFSMTAADYGTDVVWRFEHDFGLNLFGRYFGLLLDGIVGPDAEAGLGRLKVLAEGLPPNDFSDLEIEHMVVEAQAIAFMPTSSEPLAQAISAALGDAYFQVLSFIDEQGLIEAGAPISISRAFKGAELRFDAAVPVKGITPATARKKNAVEIGESYGGPVIRVRHTGSYLMLGRTHDKIAAYLAATGIERNGDAWESYVSDPTRTASDDLLTYVYYPIEPDG